MELDGGTGTGGTVTRECGMERHKELRGGGREYEEPSGKGPRGLREITSNGRMPLLLLFFPPVINGGT